MTYTQAELEKWIRNLEARITKLESTPVAPTLHWLHVEQITDVVCKQFGVKLTDIRRSYALNNAKNAKIVAVHLTDTYTQMKHGEIAAHFGMVSHSGVGYCNKQVEQWRRSERLAEVSGWENPYELELKIIDNIYSLI